MDSHTAIDDVDPSTKVLEANAILTDLYMKPKVSIKHVQSALKPVTHLVFCKFVLPEKLSLVRLTKRSSVFQSLFGFKVPQPGGRMWKRWTAAQTATICSMTSKELGHICASADKSSYRAWRYLA